MAGHGLVADLALTGRILDANEALSHGVVSRVVPDDKLDETCLEIAHAISKAPAFTVQMFRRTLSRMANPDVQRSIQEEALTQSLVFQSRDYAEMKSARSEKRDPKYRGR
jgi:enoyl-CoA hydratase/carnithine racemase